MAIPRRVKLVEVGPRDGLQNEPGSIPTAVKLEFIEALSGAGYSEIEATSFVHPKWVPQLADAEEVARALTPRAGLVYTALVPNLKGLERAAAVGFSRVAVFTAASEAFTQKNTNRTIAENLADFEAVIARARELGLSVRGYVSTAFECPYQGRVPADSVVRVTQALLGLGVDEVSLGDTIGTACPREVGETVSAVLERVPAERLALHFHDTCGTALANVYRGLELGISTYDCSAGGLGGCPYAPGAAGNLASEDLIYMLDRMGIETGVSLTAVARASQTLAGHLGRPLPSRQLQRLLARR